MTIRLGAMASLCALLAACASMQPDSGGPTIAGDGTCRLQGLDWAKGQTATQDVMGRIWKQSGAGLIRPIAPNQAVTRDHRPDRVNVHIDAGNVVTGIDCG
jgi:hypothetical protein